MIYNSGIRTHYFGTEEMKVIIQEDSSDVKRVPIIKGGPVEFHHAKNSLQPGWHHHGEDSSTQKWSPRISSAQHVCTLMYGWMCESTVQTKASLKTFQQLCLCCVATAPEEFETTFWRPRPGCTTVTWRVKSNRVRPIMCGAKVP